MRIGIIGAGNVGCGLGRHLAANGHDIVVSFARSDDQLQAAADRIGGGARPGTPGEASRHGEVVILATPWAATMQALQGAGRELAGRILWDTTNPLKPDMSGLEIGTTSSGGEQVAAWAPGNRVVKAIAPFAELLHGPSMLIGGRAPGVFVCSDDPAASDVILRLVGEIGADGVAAGPLANARYTEPLGMLLVQLAYVQGMGAGIGASLLRPVAGVPGSTLRGNTD